MANRSATTRAAAEVAADTATRIPGYYLDYGSAWATLTEHAVDLDELTDMFGLAGDVPAGPVAPGE